MTSVISSTSTATVPTTTTTTTPSIVKTYKYSVEISQMCFVFERGYISPPEEVVHYIEDIVKSQLVEIVLQAKIQATRRGSRGQVSVEDLMFLIRHDKAKLNRLRSYLSWKDVRKNVKEAEMDDQPEIDTMADNASDKGYKVNKLKTKIPWELKTMYSEHIIEDSDSENDDEVEAYEASKIRLKQADDRTRNMSKEQYTFFTECRQASFSYRKGKKFRDFINIGAYIDGSSDELIEVLGFLAYEMVRSLCESSSHYKQELAIFRATSAVTNLKQHRRLEEEKANRGKLKKRSSSKDRGTEGGKDDMNIDKDELLVQTPRTSTSDSPNKSRKLDSSSNLNNTRSPPRLLVDPLSLFSEPIESQNLPSGLTTPGGQNSLPAAIAMGSITMLGPPDKITLQLHELSGAYHQIQTGQAALKSNGMKNWRSGFRRGRPELI